MTDPAPTSPRQPVSAREWLLANYELCDCGHADHATLDGKALKLYGGEDYIGRFKRLATGKLEMLEEVCEAYRSASLPVTPELPGAKVIHDKRGHLLAFDPECEECVKGLNQAKSEAASLPVQPIDQAFSGMATDETYQRESEKVRESMDRLSTSGQEIAQPLHQDCHDVVCNSSRRFPRGHKGDSCSCAYRDGIQPAHSPAVQALESQPSSKVVK